VKTRLFIAATVILSIAFGLGCIDVNVIQSGTGGGGVGGVGADAGTNRYDALQDSTPSVTCHPTSPKQAVSGDCLCDGDCTSGFCVENVCCNTACTGGCNTCSSPSSLGICVKLPAGTAPRNPSDCPAQTPETCGLDGTCDGAGACRRYLGTICAGGTCYGDTVVGAYTCDGIGQCKPGVTELCLPYSCDPATGTCLISCTENTQCSSGACDIATGSCGQIGVGAHCASNDDCISGFCADGVCCNVACQGACLACNLPGRLGTCWAIDAGMPDPRGVCADQGAASCGHDGTCNGSGGCARYAPGTVCAGETCSAGLYTPPSTCSANGQCAAPDSRACAPYVCNGTACFNTCATNDQCKTPSICDGTSSCGLKSIGATCLAAAECGSGFCAQGICCNSACSGACQSCALTNALGTCTSVPAGVADPQGTCHDIGAASCGTNGRCDGKGSCQKYSQGTTCLGSSCPSGTTMFAPASTCDGAGNCVTPDAISCFPYQCNGNVCVSSCAADADCAVPGTCIAGSCGPKSNGQVCATATECSSGFCSQGTCCATDCQATCQSCALTTSLGTCTNVINGVADPQGTCRDAGNASCGTDGFCNGAGGCRLYAAGTSCAAPACATGSSTLTSGRSCDGNGTCQAATTIACAPYVCNGATACKAACTMDADCLSPDICDLQTNLCGTKKRLGQACVGTSDCLTGDSCVDGVCCASVCQDPCFACNLPGSAGACVRLPNPDAGSCGS
jgi:hypothetical protein